MLTKEKLAEAARNEVADHIRAHPGAWITEIAEGIDDRDAFIAGVLREYAGHEHCAHRTQAEAINVFAEKAGQSAYDSIIGHPGII